MSIKKSNEQIYGRNNQVMLEMHDKIYGSLGISEQYVLNTVEGNLVVLSNPKSGKLNDAVTEFRMQGWTEQNQYEGKNLWNFEQSIEFERVVRMTFDEELPAGEYTFSAVVHSTDTDDSQCLLIFLTADGGQMAYYIGRSNGDSRVSAKISMSIPAAAISLYASTLNVTSEGDTASFVDIMLNAGDTPLPYEPYTGGQPSPSPDYPQEIISAGKYDEGTGKYQYTIKISDSEESPTKSQTVTLTSDRLLTKWDRLEKRNGQWGWVYGSVEITLLGQNESYALHSSKAIIVPESNLGITEERKDYYSNQFVATTKHINGLKNGESCIAYNNLYLKVNAVTSPEEAKSWIQSNKPKFLLQADIPAFVPLSESEQEQINELYTFRPTTVLSNDCECEMKVTYKATQSLEV